MCEQVYTLENKKFLVLSSAYNNGCGAVVCRIDKVRLYQLPPFLIANNAANNYFASMPAHKMLHPSFEFVFANEAAEYVRAAILKFQKMPLHERAKSYPPEVIFHGIISIAIRALEKILVKCNSIWTIKMSLKRFYMPIVSDYLDTLLVKEAEKRFLNAKARVIQRAWRTAIVCPYTEMCQRRLRREFENDLVMMI